MQEDDVFGTCPLCQEENIRLALSHYMPSALYSPRNKDLEYFANGQSGIVTDDLKERLLCHNCEALFDRNGESYVLNLIRTKAPYFPLQEKLRLALARDSDPSCDRFSGNDLGIDTLKFAYFAWSIVWRGAVGHWKNFDGSDLIPVELGSYQEPIRQYLLGKAPMPHDTAVVVIVTKDQFSRETWFVPQPLWEFESWSYRFHARGVFFRVMMGPHLPQYFRDSCCTSPYKCIFFGDGERRTREAFSKYSSNKSKTDMPLTYP
jgi:hypothetical protein